MRLEPRSRVRRSRPLVLLLALIVATGGATSAAPRPAPATVPPPGAVASEPRLGDLALSLDFDLERIFRFVADEIRYEPYAGILRGARGTLDAGAGNSLDQALLLAALLDESAIAYRFARGSLDETGAERLVASAQMDAAGATAAAELGLSGGPYPAQVQLPPAEPADPEEVAAIEAATQAALETGDERVSRSVRMITSALADEGISLGDGSSPSLASLLPVTETTGHAWVQVARGPTWLDLDPTLGPGAVMGTTLTGAAETLDALPDELRHVVRFEVLLEQVRGDGLVTTPVIDYAGFADELAGRPITNSHIPPSAVQRLGVAIGSLAGETRLAYHPVLVVPEGTVVSTEPIRLGASIGDGDGPSDLSDVFDTASPEPGALSEGEASAEWLAVTVESPGREPLVARRPIFDRVPAEVRYGGEPTAADVQPVELVAFADGGLPDFAALLGTETFAVSTGPTNGPAMLALAGAPEADIAAILATSYLGLRDVVAAQETMDAGVSTFVDRPGVVSFSIDLAMEGDEPTVTSRVDLWHRSLGAVPTRGGGTSLAHANLRAGVVEHIAEGLAMEAGLGDGGLAERPIGVRSLFEAAAASGIPTLVLQDGIPSGTRYEPQARALIDEALRAGDVVVVPAEPVPMAGRARLGWWRIDPLTGVTADMMDDGTASEMVEISPILRVIACAAVFMPAYTQILSAIFSGTASTLLGIASGASAGYWIWNARNVPAVLGACTTGTVPA